MIFCMLIPTMVALSKLQKLNKPLRIFLLYCLITFAVNVTELWYVYNGGLPILKRWLVFTGGTTNFLLILHQIKNFICLGWFFSLVLSTTLYARWVWNISLLLSIVALIAYLLEKGWINYGTVGPIVETCFLVAVPLFYLWYLSTENLGIPLMKHPYFIIGLGLASVGVVTSLLFFLADPLQDNDFCLFARFSIAKNCFEIMGYLLFALAFWRARYARFLSYDID